MNDKQTDDNSLEDLPHPFITPDTTPPNGESRSSKIWNTIEQIGIAEPVLRIGGHILTIVVVLSTVIVLGNFYLNNAQPANQVSPSTSEENDVESASTSSNNLVTIPELISQDNLLSFGIPRLAEPETIIPSRPRVGVAEYIVELGDSIFSIAEQFGLRPETILWGNIETLDDNPRLIKVGQELNILPTDGVYYRYNIGENLRSIAQFFDVQPELIIEWPGNKLDPFNTDLDNPEISDGTWLIIPGGRREFKDWGPPAITRANPAVASYYGSGSCGSIYEGAIGNGTFSWPTPASYLSGFDYSDFHPGIDIAGDDGNAIWATDSGVVVFNGWTTSGYGILLVIDHGNGWQSAYAHLSQTLVACGQSVFQGDKVASLGNTGDSSGSHLHFELRSDIYGKVNPWNFLITP